MLVVAVSLQPSEVQQPSTLSVQEFEHEQQPPLEQLHEIMRKELSPSCKGYTAGLATERRNKTEHHEHHSNCTCQMDHLYWSAQEVSIEEARRKNCAKRSQADNSANHSVNPTASTPREPQHDPKIQLRKREDIHTSWIRTHEEDNRLTLQEEQEWVDRCCLRPAFHPEDGHLVEETTATNGDGGDDAEGPL